MLIKISYQASDGYRMNRQFKTLKGARAFAQNWVGKYPDVGAWYAVSQDGVGRIMVSGVNIRELFQET